tara:strand:- start:7088 stop:17254 length:10167 start_codon:yes stop_codon:yes gene_type:complete
MRSAGGVVDKGLLTAEEDPSKIIFQINDIDLIIPPTNISVRKEDMMWQWKTLRTKVSTKVPSGHGIVQVSVRLVFTPDLFLHMHRLICQLRHSPFCYVESRYLRDSICPDWPLYQNMAFTMTNLTVQNFKGSPGTFMIDLDLRWFNYKPYALNWMYRDEWQTIPFYSSDGNSYVRRTIDTFGKELLRQPTITSFGDSERRPGSGPLDNAGNTDYGAIDSFDSYSKPQDITGGRSINSMLFTHAGEVFDLLPRDPWVMRKATPVLPQYSNIYKRYCNYLQQKNLYECFGVDIADMMDPGDWARYTTGYYPSPTEPSEAEMEGHGIDRFTQGAPVSETSTSIAPRAGAHFIVDALHGPTTSRALVAQIADACYAQTKKITFYWHEFTALDVRFDIVQAMQKQQQEAVRERMEALRVRSRGLEDIVGARQAGSGSEYEPEHGHDSSWTYVSEFSEYSRRNTSPRDADWGRLPTTSELEGEYLGVTDYFFYAPIPGYEINSGFGMRTYNGKTRPHNGIDVAAPKNTPIYAAEDGILWVSQTSTANRMSARQPDYMVNTTTGEKFSDFSEVPFGRGNGYGLQLTLEVTGLAVLDEYGEIQPGASWEITYSHLNKVEEVVNGNRLATYNGTHGTRGCTVQYHATGMADAIQVRRGDLIGYVGNTGYSGGNHLHCETTRAGTKIDPLISFTATRSEAATISDASGDARTLEEIDIEIQDILQGINTSDNDGDWFGINDYKESPIDEDSTGSSTIPDEGDEGWASDLEIPPEEQEKIRREYESFIQAGWVEYEDNQDVSNVLKRTVAYTFISENSNFWPTMQPDFSMPITQAMYEGRADSSYDSRSSILNIKSPDNLVVSNIVGSINHIVASIPLIGQEFPTHQHLGSMEPSYVLEFVTSADSENNDNLSEEGALLEYMRSNLQKNARVYRPIPDGHCVATDHFITRLLGSYKDPDFFLPEDNDQEFLKKRTVIHRTQQNTVEGTAGMSSFVMELSETNPYDTEVLTVISEQPSDRDELRSRVLNKIWSLDLSEDGLASLLMAELTRTISDPKEIANYLAEQNLTAAHFANVSDIKEIENLTIMDHDALRRQEFLTTEWPIEHYVTGSGRAQQSDFQYIRTEQGYGYFWEAMEASGKISSGSGGSQTELSPTSEIAYQNSQIGAEKKTANYILDDTSGMAFNLHLPSPGGGSTIPVQTDYGMYEAVKMNEDRTGSSDWWLIGNNSVTDALRESGDFGLLFGEIHDRREGGAGGGLPSIPELTQNDIEYFQKNASSFPGGIPSEGAIPTADEIETWYNQNNRSVTSGNVATLTDKYVINSTDYYDVHQTDLGSVTAKEGSGEEQVSALKELWMTLNNILRTGRLILAESELQNGLENGDIAKELYDLPEEATKGCMWSGYISWLMYYFRELAATGEGYDSYEELAAATEGLTPADIDGIYGTVNWGFNIESKLKNQDLQWIEGNAMMTLSEERQNFLEPFADVWEAWGTNMPTDIAAGNFTGEMFNSTDSEVREAQQRFDNAVQGLGRIYAQSVIPFNKGLKMEVIGDLVPSIAEALTHSFVDEVLGGNRYFGVRDQVNIFNDWFFSPEYLMNSPTMSGWLYSFRQGAMTAGATGWILVGLLWAGTAAAAAIPFDGPAGEAALGAAALARTRSMLMAGTTKGMSAQQLAAYTQQGVGRQLVTQFGRGQNMGLLAGGTQVAVDPFLQLKTATDKARGRVFEPTAPGTTPGIIGESPWAFMQHNVVGGTPEKGEFAWQMTMNQSPDPGLDNLTNLDQERQKLAQLKRILTEFADRIIGSPALMAAIGFADTELPEQGLVNEYVGAECYPDLDLPKHPYYDSRFAYSVTPDFYMWNAYEDAGLGVRGAIEEEVYNQSRIAVEAAYRFHKRTQKNGLEPKSDAGLSVYSASADLTPRLSRIVSHPEGSDQVDLMKADVHYEWAVPGAAPGPEGNPYDNPGTARVYGKPVGSDNTSAWVDTGPTGNPFHGSLFGLNSSGLPRTDELSSYRSKRQESLQTLIDNADERHTGIYNSTEVGLLSAVERPDEDVNTYATDEEIVAAKTSVIPISSTDGNPQYISQTSVDKHTYGELAQKMRGFEAMMGSREAYLGNVINKDTASKISRDLAESRINTIAEYEQFYDPANLQNLARNSSSDIISNKMSMKRAYPTFKLFFVEEDEHESRFLNMDDFYSYNAVKEFTFYATRKDPGDTATIVLQNVNGTLDGTRRNSIVDLDYFNEKEAERIAEDNPNIATRADNSEVAANDQPFTALVLRPGMNVQLRVGYSNDPNMLSVLLNGRATDIAWNKNGDLVEITVQSFGTELTQKIKGVGGTDRSVDWDNQTYYSTHQLLGAMMTQPELHHFGRWEYGRLRQIGEDKSADLDFYPYSREGFVGNNPISNSLTSWISNHPVLSIALATGTLIAGMLAVRAGGARLVARGSGGRVAGGGQPLIGPMQATETFPGAMVQTARPTVTYVQQASQRSRVFSWLSYNNPLSPGENIVGYALMTPFRILGSIIKNVRSGGPGWGSAVRSGGPAMRLGTRWGSSIDDLVASADELAEVLKPGFNGTAGRAATAAKQLIDRISGIRGSEAAAAAAARITQAARTAANSTGNARLLARQNIAREVYELQTRAAVQRFAWWPMGAAAQSLKGWAGRSSVAPLAWMVGKATFGNLFIKGPANLVRAAVPLWIAAKGADLLLTNITRWAQDNYINKYRQSVAKVKATLKMTPADDNLFPPNPASYMTLGWYDKKSFWERNVEMPVRAMFDSILNNYVGITYTKMSEWFDAWSDIPDAHILEKRVRPGACRYKLRAQTIWQTFQEMSHRHPGWIYGVRPYGTKFRNTMFFGVPSQRYWARPGDTNFVQRMNKIHRYLNDPGNNYNTLRKQAEELYPRDIIQEWYDTALLAAQALNPTLPSPSAEAYERWEHLAGDTETKAQTMWTDHFQNRMMQEFVTGMENRFVPFRRWHMITSDQDIVQNGIMTSESSVVNAVNVQYIDWNEKDGRPRETSAGVSPIKTQFMKASSQIPDNMLNTAVVNYPNCKGQSMALRYGQSALMYGLREMYKGEIMILGNPRIRPWDVCILMDDYNDMYGPVEVESVVHMFSHETGFLTEIKPNAVVMANEISTWPILEGIKLFAMAVKSVEENGKGADFFGNTDMFFSPEADSRMVDFFMKKYSTRFGQENPLEDFIEVLEDNGLVEDGRDIVRSANSNRLSATYGILSGIFGTAALAAGSGRLLMNVPRLLGAARHPIRNFNLSHYSPLIQSVVAIVAGQAGISGMTQRSGAIGSSAAWLIGMPILFAKCMEEETVNVVPLIKGNRPIVSGLTLKSPAELFNSILGNVTNAAEDTMNGMTRLVDEWQVYKAHSWAAYDKIHGNRSGFVDRYIHHGVTMFDWSKENL